MDSAYNAQPPGPWADQAACKGHTRLMVCPRPSGNSDRRPPEDRVKTQRAMELCLACPVLAPCRQWALTDPDPAHDMIAGGMTPVERNTHRRRRTR